MKTAEAGKISDKGMEKKTRPILNMKLDGNSQESYTSLKRLDMYSFVKMKRRLGGSTQRPFINITSFPKEGPSQLHISDEDFTKNHDTKVGKRVRLATKEKGDKKRWKKLKPSSDNHGQVVLREQNVGTIDSQKKHKFRAKVDLDQDSKFIFVQK